MEYGCRDIPMRLDIRHQPLNFDIYLSQVIDVPRTSLEEEPYNFKLELDALDTVEQIIIRTQYEQDKLRPPQDLQQERKLETGEELPQSNTVSSASEPKPVSNVDQSALVDHQSLPLPSPPPPPILVQATLPPPSCPVETPLTPIKSSVTPANSSTTSCNTADSQPSSSSKLINSINLGDFEDTNYNPFDHLELQTIDELKELRLVFQASYANQPDDINTSNSINNSINNQLEPSLETNNPHPQGNSNTLTKSM